MTAPLYEEWARLLALPDAYDPGSETAHALKALDAQLCEFEAAEAQELARAFETSLQMPIDAGARAAYRFDELVARFGPDDYRKRVKAKEHSDILAIMALARASDVGTTIVIPKSSTATVEGCEASKARFCVYGVTFVDEVL